MIARKAVATCSRHHAVAAARGGLVRGRERLEAGLVADLLERGEERDGQSIGLEQAVAQIVERQAAVPRRERLVHGAAQRRATLSRRPASGSRCCARAR